MAEITTTERLPFPLAKPNPDTFVTQASEIGHNNKSVADYISEIEDMFEYVGDDTPAICGQAICGQAICGVI
jgi:hypothetical protein